MFDSNFQLRRIRFDLTYVYKLLFGMVDLNFDDFFALSSCSTTRDYNYRLFYIIRGWIFVNTFSWNNLERNVIDFNSFKRFKMSLLSCDMSKYVHF